MNWDIFGQLPGDPARNWENLCPSVVLRNFGSLGSFRSVAQQPGLEFHLRIDRTSGTLGDPGRWWGWQCRWYDVQLGRQIGTRRRNEVEAAIRKTEEILPQVTDWVLWTKRPLTPTDQEWFYAIVSSMDLRLWNDSHLDSHLVGDASILRGTYFGDLVLTPDKLRELREGSLGPVRERWIPEVHVEVDPEVEIRKYLGEAEYWPELSDVVSKLAASIEEVTPVVNEIDEKLRPTLTALVEDVGFLCTTLSTVADALTDNELMQAIKVSSVPWEPKISQIGVRQLARALRGARHPSSLDVQAMIARQHDALQLYWILWRYLSRTLVAVIGTAGSGKTHLAAALTAAKDGRPCGVYFEAWPLERRGTIDRLLPRLRGLEVSSFRELLEAVEAAGERAGVRIPIVIDGLNESEDPGNWKGELESLSDSLKRFQHVVVVVTVRPTTADVTLPKDLPRVRVQGFSSITEEAVRRYFNFYKIDPGSLRLPLHRFRDPLFLRIFCESTNPDRRLQVQLDGVPTSLATAFIGFKRAIVERIVTRPGALRRNEQDVLKAIDTIALSLWCTRRRGMSFDDLRELIRDDSVSWTDSLARVLADEGLLNRETDPGGDQRTAFLFDALAGFLIADALTNRMDRDDFQEWIRKDSTVARLHADPQQAHPLATDIRKALASLIPRNLSFQLWPYLDGELQTEAIVDAADLEGSLLDDATSDEIGRIALLPAPNRYSGLFDRFFELRDATDHPLNAEFLDQLLSRQSVADRDLSWSEWIRASSDWLHHHVLELAKEWQERQERTLGDQFQALWLKWILTTTVRPLRDQATMSLYWYGRNDPGGLFELTLSSLKTNDPYVPERTLAASYGVVMGKPSEGRLVGDELSPFLGGLWASFCDGEATSPTEHWLVREYVEGVVEFTRRYYPEALGDWSGGARFATPVRAMAISIGDPRLADNPYLIDYYFENYTIPRLVPGRFSRIDGSTGYEEVSSSIRGRIWDLGWRPDRFALVDQEIGKSRYYEHNRPDRIESYAQKYGWIGFYEVAGRLQAEGRLTADPEDGRLSDVDIDPSFPAVPSPLALTLPDWLPSEPQDPQKWMSGGQVSVPDYLLRTTSLEGHDGPWVVLSGYLSKEDIELRREVFGFLQGILVRRSDERRLTKALQERDYPGNHWIREPPEAYYLFAGEMPWSERVRQGRDVAELQGLYAGVVRVADGQDIPIEIPVHDYSWESYHSSVNQAGGRPVPAMTFADTFDLHAVPASLDWCDSEGKRVSVTLSAPPDFKSGHLLYVREDLVRAYCDNNGYVLVWIVWGERGVRLTESPVELPEWLREVYANRCHIWRRVTTLSEIESC